MNVALGFKAHSGWAAVVTIAKASVGVEVIDRRRIELIDEGELWAKQPYHAAEELEPGEARLVVKKGIASAQRVAVLRIKEIVRRSADSGYQISACGILAPEPMPDWGTDEILSVHIRMHKAEGVLFPDALYRAAEKNGIQVVSVPEKRLDELAQKALRKSGDDISKMLVAIGRSIGPPWTRDQKTATLAAMVAMKTLEKA
jgi:hypothetical protein